MIILDNTLNSQTIRLRLGDKYTPNGLPLTLILYRVEEGNKAYSFTIPYPSISSVGVYTFTINPSTLGSSDYKAAVIEGLPDIVFPGCEILTNTTLSNDGDSPCDPLLLEAELTFDALLVLGDVQDLVIYLARARVEGTTNFTTTVPNIQPTYTVYEG
jgi:hypothetical protein